MNLKTVNISDRKRYSLAAVAAGGIFLIFSVFAGVFASQAQAVNISPPRLELEGDPGSRISSSFKVTNDSDRAATYYTQVENFEARDESGNPQFVQSQEGLAIWTSVNRSVTVAAGEQIDVPFTINIPSNAEPGGYFASIFIRTTPPPTGGEEVSIGARLGTLLLVRVNGQIKEGVDILEYSTKNNKKFYTSLPVEFYYRFQNTGNDRVKPVGEIVIKNLIGLKAKILSANRTDGSVLPSSIRRFEMAWINAGGGQEDVKAEAVARNPGGFFEEAKYQLSHFAFGYYTANLDIVFGDNNNTASGKIGFFVIPWQLLTIVLAGLIVIYIVLRFILRRYNRYIISKHAGQ